MKKVQFLLVLFLAASLVAVSCGKSNGNPTQSSKNNSTPIAQDQPQEQVGYAEVTIPGRNFTPDLLVVAVGTTVKWVSRDGEQHTVTSDIPNLFNGTIEPFGSFSYTFNQTGNYEYFCSIHGQMGMRGVVQVK